VVQALAAVVAVVAVVDQCQLLVLVAVLEFMAKVPVVLAEVEPPVMVEVVSVVQVEGMLPVHLRPQQPPLCIAYLYYQLQDSLVVVDLVLITHPLQNKVTAQEAQLELSGVAVDRSHLLTQEMYNESFY
jgi:hypothetical protein